LTLRKKLFFSWHWDLPVVIFGYYERDKYAKKIKLAFLPVRICAVLMNIINIMHIQNI
jgi:hypothetical protein